MVVGFGVGGAVCSSVGCCTRAVGSDSGGWGFGRRAFSFWIAPVSRAPTVGLDAGGGKFGGDSA
jgi:hypothetical protein